MANVITDSNGNVLTVNGGAFTVDASVDANITAGNIKKNVSILGVTGTYDGHTAGNLEDDVNFRDYDGTIIASYTAAEFANLSALPANPSHSGLVALGWNWSLAGAKTYVARHGGLEIGQMYVTDDGKTRLYVETPYDNFGATLVINQTVSEGISVDWGDGSAAETISGTGSKTFTHTYTTAGQYVIRAIVNSGTFKLGQNAFGSGSSKISILRKIECGLYFTGFEDAAINNAWNLGAIAMSNGIADKYVRMSSVGLKYLVVPTSVSNVEGHLVNIPLMNTISLPEGLLKFTPGNDAVNFYRKLYIPDTVTTLKLYKCSHLEKLEYNASALTSVPDSMFNDCSSLTSVSLPLSVTSFGGVNCLRALKSVREITLPSGLTSIPNNTFYDNYSLSSITIPASVTSINTGAFQNCYSLIEITIPALVTSIGNNAFANCWGLLNYYFLPTTPPTFGTTPISSDAAIIHVPHGCLEAYQTAYPDRASQMVEMPE